jgi:type I restriction enzyme S subunit
MRHEIGRRATGTSGSMKNISQEKLLGIRTILPDIQEQREFSRRFLSAQRLSRTYQESALSMDSLFTSLQHRAFNGEVQDAR